MKFGFGEFKELSFPVVLGIALLSLAVGYLLAIKTITQMQEVSASAYPDTSKHIEWAKKINDGGFILYWRHTNRSRYPDATAFDALELSEGIDASTSFFSAATCLTEQGVEEAKMIAMVLAQTNMNISEVITSPSCRARQTSEFAFGGEGKISSLLLHRTAIIESEREVFSKGLRALIDDIEMTPGSNVVLSGHGKTLGYDGVIVIDESFVQNVDDRQEGGFVVLEKKDGRIIAHHIFRNFSDYANATISLTDTISQPLEISMKPNN